MAVDTTGTRYYLQRDRADDADLAFYISPPPQGGDDIAVPLYQAMIELLATWQTRTTGAGTAADDSDVDEPARCRTPDCDGDPDEGDGFSAAPARPPLRRRTEPGHLSSLPRKAAPTARMVVSTMDDWQCGGRVVLEHTNDPYPDLEPGDEGTVTRYHPLTGQLMVDWNTGSRLIMLPDAGDSVERV